MLAPNPGSVVPTDKVAGDANLRKPVTRRRRIYRILEKLAAPAFALGLILLWELFARYSGISEFVLPAPSAIVARMGVDHRLLLSNAYVTAIEVLGGFLIATVAGIGLALAIFYLRIVEIAIYPILIALQTIPKVALAPLIVIYFGYGWGPKLFLSFIISFFVIVVSTVVGLQGMDSGYARVVRSMGATERQIFLKVRLPAALPSIFGSLKVALTLAVIGAVLGEYVAAEKGLGYLQLQANANFDMILNYAAVVSIGLLGVLFYGLIRVAERIFVAKRASSR